MPRVSVLVHTNVSLLDGKLVVLVIISLAWFVHFKFNWQWNNVHYLYLWWSSDREASDNLQLGISVDGCTRIISTIRYEDNETVVANRMITAAANW